MYAIRSYYDHPADKSDGFLVGVDGEFAPRLKIEHFVLGIDRPRHIRVEQAESTSDAGDMNGKEASVKYEHPRVKHPTPGSRIPEPLYPPLRLGSILSRGAASYNFV